MLPRHVPSGRSTLSGALTATPLATYVARSIHLSGSSGGGQRVASTPLAQSHICAVDARLQHFTSRRRLVGAP